jgi:hypothetical protein
MCFLVSIPTTVVNLTVFPPPAGAENKKNKQEISCDPKDRFLKLTAVNPNLKND